MKRGSIWAWLLVWGAVFSAQAQPCPGVKKRFHFTFDDGPAEPYTRKVLEALARQQVKGTFFVMGERLTEKNMASLEKIQSEGHLLASHTYSHINSEQKEFTMEAVKKNIDDFYVEAKKLGQLRARAGKVPLKFSNYIRMPYGAYFWNQDRLRDPRATELRQFLAERKLRHVLWNIDSQDYTMRGTPRATYVARVLRRIRQVACDPHSPDDLVVLFHDIQPQTAEGVEEVIRQLKAEGHQFTDLESVVRNKNPGAAGEINPKDPTFDPIDFPHLPTKAPEVKK